MEKVIKLSMDDVITSSASNGIVDSPTFRCQEGLMKLASKADIHWATWTQNGMPCQVIGEKIGGWKRGKVRICLEFIPDEPEQKSPLDELRQQVTQI